LEAVHEARLRFARERIDPPAHGLYEDFPAIIHARPETAQKTNDSRAELLAAAKKTGIQVVLLTEPREPTSDAWRGIRDGVLFIAGAETNSGTLWFPEFSTNNKPMPDGGLRFLRYPAKSDDASAETFTGVQIGNRQPDPDFLTKAVGDPKRWQQVLNDFESFPDEFFGAASSYDEKTFQRWDQATQKKHLTVIGANDSQKHSIGGKNFGPYEVSFRNLVTHILATEKTEPAIRDALTRGRVYLAHDWLCPSAGFGFGAVNNLGVFGMGDTAPMLGKTRLSAITPLSATLRLIHNGSMIKEVIATNLIHEASETGVYRLEAWLEIDGELRPWIFSNPIYLRGPTLTDMKLPSMEVSPEVEVSKDLVYREGPAEEAGKHKLDIYRPKDKSSLPVLFFVHGGAWRSGDRSYYPPLGNRYAKEGFVTVIPSYRLAPKYKHPAQIEDVAAAFAWTVRHVAEYGGDTNRIFAAGHSAGAHLAALLALDPSHLAAWQLSPTNIRAVLAFSGVYNLAIVEAQSNVFGDEPAVRRAASPVFHASASAPPFLVTYCEWDYFTLPAQARMFHRALKRSGANSDLLYVPGENHLSEMINVTRAEDPTVSAAVKFMHRF
jgi:acetyl esterase/lipase